MDTTTRFGIGLLSLLAIQILLGGTIMFLVRRSKQVAPVWSWLRTIRAFVLLGLLVTAVGIVPMVGWFAAGIVWLIGLKRISGLDILSTFILSLSMGILVYAISGVISTRLQVELLR